MFEAFIKGTLMVFTPLAFLALCSGAILGCALGVIPGINSLILLALALPFIYGMPPEVGLSLMIGLYSCCNTGGSIPAILIGVPGHGANVATVLDGYKMAQKGEAARACGAMFGASGMGGVLGVIIALAVIPFVRAALSLFGIPEILALVILGIAFIGVLAERTLTKGLMAGLLGIFVALIGYHPATGIGRFSFNTLFLYDGIGLVPVVLGLFVIPAILDLAQRGNAEKVLLSKKTFTLMKEMFEGVKDVFRHFGLFMRSSIIGFIVGAVPGIGSDVAIWVAYAQAARTSKHPERFGTGIVEGVIAPEASSNTKEGGALLPTLSWGVPGSAAMAILLGAFTMLGIVPGPAMLSEHLDLSFMLLVALAVANIIGVAFAYVFVVYLIKMTSTSIDYLIPVISVLIAVGAFAFKLKVLDLVVLSVAGLLGYCFKKYSYSRPAFLLGFVLGGLFETNLFLALGIYGWSFLLRPITLIILFLSLMAVVYDPIMYRVRQMRATARENRAQ